MVAESRETALTVPARRAEGVLDKGPREERAGRCQLVDVRCVHKAVAVAAKLRPHVICDNEQHAFAVGGGRRAAERQGDGGEGGWSV